MAAIQPCALLLLVSGDWRVGAASANVGMLGDFRASSVVGQPLADLIGSKAIHSLRNRMSWLARDESEVQDFGVQWGDITLDVRAASEQDFYLVEAELSIEPRLPDGIGMVRSMSDRLSGTDPVSLASQAMQQVGALSGFERVMLCDRGGAVVAANRGEPVSLRFENNGRTRIIADRDAEPVPIVGDNSIALLAHATHLAPDEATLDEMRAADIAAAMVLPLRIDGEQVGVLKAFHASPRRCSAERRSVIHLFAERLVARMARQGWKP